MQKINELDQIDLPVIWGKNIPRLYEEFIDIVTAGQLPGVTLDDVRRIEAEVSRIGK